MHTLSAWFLPPMVEIFRSFVQNIDLNKPITVWTFPLLNVLAGTHLPLKMSAHVRFINMSYQVHFFLYMLT